MLHFPQPGTDVRTDTASLDFPFPEPPPEGAAREIVPGLWWVRMPLPFALDHVNLWLIDDGADGWTVIDCGIASDRSRAIWEQVFATTLKGRPVTRVLATHFHPDHVGLADWIAARDGARLWMSRTEWLMARMLSQNTRPELDEAWLGFYRSAGVPADWLQGLAVRGNAYPRGVPSVPASFMRLSDGDRIRLGEREWRVIIGQGHSPEHVCLWSEDTGILIAGDQILPRISPNVSIWPSEPAADPLADFLRSLERLRELPDGTLILPSHGLPFRGLHARAGQLAAHHEERLSDVLRACAEAPRSAADVTRFLFPRALDAHQLSFALGEAVAHLTYLTARGRLLRDTDSQAVWKFRTAD